MLWVQFLVCLHIVIARNLQNLEAWFTDMVVVGVRIKSPTNFYMIVLYNVCQKQCAQVLSDWAKYQFGLSAEHPASYDEAGNSRKKLMATT